MILQPFTILKYFKYVYRYRLRVLRDTYPLICDFTLRYYSNYRQNMFIAPLIKITKKIGSNLNFQLWVAIGHSFPQCNVL